MQEPRPTEYTIQDILEWEGGKQLVLRPKFQRRTVWQDKARSYLIDTILRGLPIPPLYIRVKVDPAKRRSVREVVDGQQRLNAVLGYIRGDYCVLPIHNRQFGGMFFVDLPEAVQTRFLSYGFTAYLLHDLPDSQVLDIFARINSFTVVLNDQEKRNAKYFGAFKQTMYELAHSHLAFWRDNRVFSEREVARMQEVEFVSILTMTSLIGFKVNKNADINQFYSEYDDAFPMAESVKRQFDAVLGVLVQLFPEAGLSRSQFKRKPLFYSLFCAVLDAMYKLPGWDSPRLSFSGSQLASIRDRLDLVSAALASGEYPDEAYARFAEASRYGTTDLDKRICRHNFLWQEVLRG